MLNNLDGFIKILTQNLIPESYHFGASGYDRSFHGELFCPRCGANRRVGVKLVMGTNTSDKLQKFAESVNDNLDVLPLLFIATCLQCQSNTTIIIYHSPNGAELVLLHDSYGGCITPNTPEEVKFYLDQAFRAKSVGASSAAATMYRSALEWVLHEQGFQKGMLKAKIEALIKSIKSNTAPIWAIGFDIDYLNIIKEIGNGSIHTNNGDISKQKEIDNELLIVVDELFAELLDRIYEQPARVVQRKVALQAKTARLKK